LQTALFFCAFFPLSEQHKCKNFANFIPFKGTLKSFVIEGFSVPVRALFDDAANLAAVKELLTS